MSETKGVVVFESRSGRLIEVSHEEATRTPEDLALIRKAKWVLMGIFAWTEREAYATMRQCSMNRRLKLTELARQILDPAVKLEDALNGPAQPPRTRKAA